VDVKGLNMSSGAVFAHVRDPMIDRMAIARVVSLAIGAMLAWSLIGSAEADDYFSPERP